MKGGFWKRDARQRYALPLDWTKKAFLAYSCYSTNELPYPKEFRIQAVYFQQSDASEFVFREGDSEGVGGMEISFAWIMGLSSSLLLL